jgi:hypothetical protein
MGIVGTHPGSFRKSDKQRSCGIPNLEVCTENRREGFGMFRLAGISDAQLWWSFDLKVERLRGSERRKPERESRDPGWSAEFKSQDSTIVILFQG